MNSPALPDNSQIALLEQSFAQLLAQQPAVAERFYQRLSADFPDIGALFAEADPQGQQQKLLAALTLLITNLQQPDLLRQYLQALGERHRQYGVSSDMLQAFVDTWLAVVSECLQSAEIDLLKAAWRQLLDYALEMMQLAETPVSTEAVLTSDSVDLAGLLHQQQQLIVNLTLAAGRGGCASKLLADLAQLQLLNSAIDEALQSIHHK